MEQTLPSTHLHDRMGEVSQQLRLLSILGSHRKTKRAPYLHMTTFQRAELDRRLARLGIHKKKKTTKATKAKKKVKKAKKAPHARLSPRKRRQLDQDLALLGVRRQKKTRPRGPARQIKKTKKAPAVPKRVAHRVDKQLKALGIGTRKGKKGKKVGKGSKQTGAKRYRTKKEEMWVSRSRRSGSKRKGSGKKGTKRKGSGRGRGSKK